MKSLPQNKKTMSKIYSDKDYFDNMFQVIQTKLFSIEEKMNGNGKPGIIDRLSTLEWRVKAIIAALPFLSAVYIKDSRDWIINLVTSIIS